MKAKKKSMGRIVKRCTALCRLYAGYRKRVRMIEWELGAQMEVC